MALLTSFYRTFKDVLFPEGGSSAPSLTDC